MLFSLEELYEILDGREAYMLRDEYTPNMCKAITCSVIVCMYPTLSIEVE
jgi:hypothetical protein